tara:strand:+ start:310 stop:501 length:192 start_codon:yes stop_codon:yes gene_type:complete
MPVTIPAALAAKFVSKSTLKTRIRVLQTSYKAQVSGMTLFVASNFDKGAVIKIIKTLSVIPII